MLRPILDRIVVLPDKQQTMASQMLILTQTKAGIVDSQQQFGRIGTIIAAGPGKRDKKGKMHTTHVKPGDRIIWGEFDFPIYHENGQEYAIIQEADIAGIIHAA